MNVEAMVWTWVYMGMGAAVFSIALLLWAIWFEYKNKD